MNAKGGHGMVNHMDMATMTWVGSHRGHGDMPLGEGEMGIDGNAHNKYAWTLSHHCMGLGGWGLGCPNTYIHMHGCNMCKQHWS